MTEPLGDPGPTSFLDSLGPRGRRRAEPRMSIAVAGAGCALAVLGVLLVAGDTGASDGGDFNKVPGIILSALVVAAGFFVLAGAERGALATAGSVAAALGVPPLMFFLTVDTNDLPPYSTEAILFVSTIAWLVTYAIGPGRGRPLFLGAGLLGVWASLLQLTEELFDAPYLVFGYFAGLGTDPSFEDGFGAGPINAPDATTIGILSLALGAGYLFLTRWLDRHGHHGVATPFALATIPPLFVGTFALADELEQAGTGLLLLAIGVGLAYHGATVWRRGTTWIGGALTVLGAAIFLGDMTDDVTLVGMLYLAAGIGLVFAGHAAAVALNEPDELMVTVGGALMATGAADDDVEPYAPDWAPPSVADLPPGHWNPPADPTPPPPPPPPAPPAEGDA